MGVWGILLIAAVGLIGLAIPNTAAQAAWFTALFFWIVIGQLLKDRDK